jgi:putative transposase
VYRGLVRKSAVPPDAAPRKPSRSHRALSETERQRVLDALHEEQYADDAPPQVFAKLLDRGIYLCSISTMYRLLRAHHEVRERRRQRTHPNYQRHELIATDPNQVWSWDITKLRGPIKWTYYCLYVILDVFSRYVVGWHLASRESADLAAELIETTCRKQRIRPGHLTLHADRGSAMTSKGVAVLLDDLGVTKTHSRPHVSNDNPYSESQFKTLKYRPEFPDRFASMEDANAFCQSFFRWYNQEHRHSSLGLMTPENVHYGRAHKIAAQRQIILTDAYRAHPERFVIRPPKPPNLPTAVWINPPTQKPITDTKTMDTIMSHNY